MLNRQTHVRPSAFFGQAEDQFVKAISWRRLKAVVGILLTIAGTATLLSDLQIAMTAVANAITNSLPYLMILIGIALIITPSRLTTGLWKRLRQLCGRYGELIYEVHFDKPLSHHDGWTLLSYDLEMRTVDAADVGVSHGLRIQYPPEDPGDQCDHRLPYSYDDVRFVEFVGKDFSATAAFMISIEVQPPDQESHWTKFTIAIGDGTPKKHGGTWTYPIRPLALGGGWQSILVDLDQVWPYTYGTEGFKRLRIGAVGIVGSLTMARITLRK